MVSKFATFTKGRRYISPTKAKLLTGKSACPCAYHFKYELGLRGGPKSLAMIRGSYFDRLCEGKGRFRPTARLDGIAVIEQRYDEYRPQLPRGRAQVAIEFELGYNEWWVNGFIDLLPDDPLTPFIEIKLATREWERRKLAYNRMQILTYSRALDFRPGAFHVSNMDERGVQEFEQRDYLPRGKTPEQAWAKVQADYIEAAKLIESDDRKPWANILCKGVNKHGDTWQCDYWAICPIVVEQKAKEMRINELKEVF